MHQNSNYTLLGGSLLLNNGKVDKYLFSGGYCQNTDSTLAFNYFNQDHLGNNREVVDFNGRVVLINNYYPFGTPFYDEVNTTNASFQPFKYNGKELDMMHGLNTYDYGARQYYSALPVWDRVDQLAEKYRETSPYVYCHDNPINRIDPDGKSSLLIIWATNANSVGHAAFAIENYKNNKPTGTYTVYGMFPQGKYDSENAKNNKTVNAKYLISKNVKLSDIKKGNFNSGESGAPDGILKINSDYSHDQKAQTALKKEIKSNKGYNARSRNCSTFAREGVRASTGNQNISGTENVGNIFVGYADITTPNQLYYETLKKESPVIVKNAGGSIQYRLDDMVDQATKEYIK